METDSLPSDKSEALAPTESPPGLQRGDLRPSTSDKAVALVEVLLSTDLVAFFVAVLPFVWMGISRRELLARPAYLCGLLLLESVLMLAQIRLLLFWRGQSWKDLGWPPRLSRELAIGAAFVPLLFVCTGALNILVRILWPSIVTEKNILLESISTPLDLALFLMIGVLTGGVKEELQRAFVLHRFDHYLGNVYVGWILWSVYFGLGHQLQGSDNAIFAGVLGLLFGALYLLRRNVVAPIAAHALFNSVTLVGFWLTRRGS